MIADCGLPRQPGHERAAAGQACQGSEQHRRARPDLDGIDQVAGAEFAQGAAQLVDGAAHGAAGGEDDVCAGGLSLAERRQAGVRGIASGADYRRSGHRGAEPVQPGRHLRAERIPDVHAARPA